MSISNRVLASILISSSTINQAEIIKKYILSKGYQVLFKGGISSNDGKKECNVAFLWFQLATARYLGGAVAPYFMINKPKAVYVTVEGIPHKSTVLCSNIPRMELIANSHHTAKCLRQADLKVVDVVHHAMDTDACIEIKKRSKVIRQKWEDEYGDRTKIIFVGRNDPRKGIEHLTRALDMVHEDIMNQAVFLFLCENKIDGIWKHQNVIELGKFGSLMYDQVLELIGASDYLLFPSMAEGFGLPVLEASAMGIPSIHCWMPPLDEFSSKEFNFVFGYSHQEMINNANVQYWLFHNYRPELLSEMIQEAISVHHNSKSQYDEYCDKALEHSKGWDYKKIYPKLVDRLQLKEIGMEISR